jgi:hypothetical protein
MKSLLSVTVFHEARLRSNEITPGVLTGLVWDFLCQV